MHIADVNQRDCDKLFSRCLDWSCISVCLIYMELTWDNCLVHCKYSSRSTPRYLTDCVGIGRLPCRLNLIEVRNFTLFRKNIKSIFCTFKPNLFSLNQYDRFDRSLLNCLAKTSKDLFDCIVLVSSAKWYVFESCIKCLDHQCK